MITVYGGFPRVSVTEITFRSRWLHALQGFWSIWLHIRRPTGSIRPYPDTDNMTWLYIKQPINKRKCSKATALK